MSMPNSKVSCYWHVSSEECIGVCLTCQLINVNFEGMLVYVQRWYLKALESSRWVWQCFWADWILLRSAI